MPFKKAVKAASKLRMSIAGVSGSGKSYTAYTLASYLADGKPFAVIDTERGSASKYADRFDFDVMELAAPYHPDRYIAAIKEAQEAGYPVLVIDSLTHAWNGAGGLLEVVEQIAKRSYGGNTFRAWADGTPIQNRLIGAITGADMHIIVTMRSKSDYVVEKDERTGKSTPRKVGMKVEQRDDMEYEYDVAGDMTPDHELIVRKSRCPDLSGAVVSKPGKPLAETLRAWLTGAPTPQKTPEPQKPHLLETASAQETLDGEEEASYYAPEDEPTPEPELEPEWQPLADAKFVASLRDIRIVSVADQEAFISEARAHHPDEPLHKACKLEYASHYNAQKKASAKPRGNRGPSALGATPANGEMTPESLAELPTGTRG